MKIKFAPRIFHMNFIVSEMNTWENKVLKYIMGAILMQIMLYKNKPVGKLKCTTEWKFHISTLLRLHVPSTIRPFVLPTICENYWISISGHIPWKIMHGLFTMRRMPINFGHQSVKYKRTDALSLWHQQ